MLPAVIAFNEATVGNEYQQLTANLRQTITDFQKLAALPLRLRDLSIDRGSLPELARDAATQWTGKHNPRPVEEKDLLQLFENTF